MLKQMQNALHYLSKRFDKYCLIIITDDGIKCVRNMPEKKALAAMQTLIDQHASTAYTRRVTKEIKGC